jgi:6-phosphogluconolactonase
MTGVDRRTLIAAAAATAVSPTLAAAAPETLRLFASGYAAEGGLGLTPIRFDPTTDRLTAEPPQAAIVNASFGAYSSRFGLHYMLDEQTAGRLAAYGAGWTKQGEVETGGADPCFVTLDARQSCLAVANYSSGSVAVVRLDPATGRPLTAQVVLHQGHGPNASRQAGAHAHWVGFSPDQRWLHAVDLGADAIFAHPFDAEQGRIAPGFVAYAAPAGSGPRHLVRHPHAARAYLVSELANTVTVLEPSPDGRFRALGAVSTLPQGFAGHSQAAGIAIDAAGRRLYVSNRGHDSIAVFALDEAGAPNLIQHIASGGDWPRFFLLIDAQRRLITANERSGDLAVFRIATDGRLEDTAQRLKVPGVAFLAQAS